MSSLPKQNDNLFVSKQKDIENNKFFQLEKIYNTNAMKKDGLSFSLLEKNGNQRNTFNQPYILGMQKSKSMIDVPTYNSEAMKTYGGLGQVIPLQDYHPAINNNFNFQNMMAFSRTLDRAIATTMSTIIQRGELRKL